jgi:hypothetical protein
MGCHDYPFVRQVICRHRVEVEVAPASAEVCFRDERHAHPLNTKVQFDAVVFNAKSSRVTWKVNGLDGSPGHGTIDTEGLYVAPAKGKLGYAFTEIITATSVDDPSRAAFARVTVIGLGPAPKPEPRVEIYPRTAELYYQNGYDNSYIDQTNKRQLFRAMLYHADHAECEWLIDSPQVDPNIAPEHEYESADHGEPRMVHIAVQLKGHPEIRDRATVCLLNYSWPGIWHGQIP